EEPYGPFGGLPEKVRVDRGKDFLSRTVTAAFDLLGVTVEDLPAYTPHLRGTVEGLNRAVESMFLAALPGYARQPRPGKRASRPKDEALLGFEDFTARLLSWTLWWNTEHCPAPLRGKTPLEAWQDDPTPLRDVPAADLWTFTLEDAGTRALTTRGVRFRRRDYVGSWMTGQAGIQVRVRFMPHHDHRIEVYHAATGRYLGPADLADQATDEQISAVRNARAARTRRLKKDLEASQRERYAAATQAEAPRLLEAGADAWRLCVGKWTPGRLALTTDLAPLVAGMPGAVPLTVAQRAEQARADQLISVFSAEKIYTEGLGVTFTDVIGEDEVIRRLGADPAKCPVFQQDSEMDQMDLFDAGGKYVVGVTGTALGCIVSQPFSNELDDDELARRLSPATTYSLFFNPKGGTSGTLFRDGAVVLHEEVGSLTPFADDPPEHWLYRFWQRPGITFPYDANHLAYACAMGGITKANARDCWALSRGPRRIVRCR
ncbi:Mu transposase C-terminal domain-containing protein, partial [Streptomyces atratus]